MTDNLEGQLTFFDLGFSSGKMSPEHCQARVVKTQAKTSRQFSRKSQGSQNQDALMCLCLKTENGPSQDSSINIEWGGCFSIAWKLHDAQYWGVPQRRKRIAVVADFNGLTAGDIVFDPQYRGAAERGESDQAE